MLKHTKNILPAFVLLLIVISASFAQQADPGTAQQPQRESVFTKGFRTKIFEVKYRDVDRLAAVVRSLMSSGAASISASSEFKSITVRDFPENLATIEEVLQRLDTPTAPRPNIELHMHVLIASNTRSKPGGTTSPIPAELRDVLKQLSETLTYQNYELATSAVQRLTTEMTRAVEVKGTAEISGENPTAPSIPMVYNHDIQSVSLVQTATGGPTVEIGYFRFTAIIDKDLPGVGIGTALNLRDGEKVVVGTANIRNRALVIVLIAKVIK
jgi:type II/III secretion system protein